MHVYGSRFGRACQACYTAGMRSSRTFLVAAGVIFVSFAGLSPARAEGGPNLAVVAPSPPLAGGDRKAAIELCQLMITPETYDNMIEQMIVQMEAALQQQLGLTSLTEARAKIKKAVVEAVPYDDVIGWNVDLYTARFSTDELKQIAGFYRTPAGKKAARLLPELSVEFNKKMGPILMERLPNALKKQGINPG
jgi:uncharacterized protein